MSPIEARQGRLRLKRDESTPGYPLNYFTGSDDSSSGDIEVSHEQYRATADVSYGHTARQNNNDPIMSTTIDTHQSVAAFDASTSSEVESFYHAKLGEGELVRTDVTTSSTHQKSHAQSSSKLISADRDVIRRRNSNSDQSRPCDDSINERIVNYVKAGGRSIVLTAEQSDISVDVTHDVFETTTSNQGGLLMGIIYQGKLRPIYFSGNFIRAFRVR